MAVNCFVAFLGLWVTYPGVLLGFFLVNLVLILLDYLIYYSGKNVYLPVFCFEGLISEFPKFTYRFPSLRASFSSQVKKCRKPDLFLGCRFSVR